MPPPKDAATLYNEANALRRVGQLNEAVTRYREALAQRPEHAKAHLNLGNALQELGRFDEAEHSYRQAITTQPGWVAPYFNLHALRLDAGDAAGAVQCLRSAVAREPASTQLRFFLGLLLDHAGHAEAAQAEFQRIEPGHALGQAWLDAWRTLKSVSPGRLPMITGTGIKTFQIGLQAARPEGLVLEFGVRFGKSIRQLAALVDGPVHGFDSFEGLPEAWHHEPQGSYSTQGELPQVPAQVSLHAGWFDATLPRFLLTHSGPARFINIDCDLYSSTRTVLDLLADRIGPGTVIVFDEYIGNQHWRQDEYRAFQEAVARCGWRYEVLCFSFATKQVAVRILPPAPGQNQLASSA